MKKLWLKDTEVACRYGVRNPSTIWRWTDTGNIPKPVKVGPGSTRWYAPTLDEHDAKLASQ